MDARLPLDIATLAWLAFGIGGVFGYAAQRSNFCTMGAIADIHIMEDWTRLRMWALAAASAVAGTTALQMGGLIDVHGSIYTGTRLIWLSHIVGGLLFGIGMTLASGCGAKTLVRLGSGNLKSLVVFVFLGLSAYMTLRGLFGGWRSAWLDPVAITLDSHQDLPSLIATRFALDPRSAWLACGGIAAGGLGLFALSSREMWRPAPLLGSVAIGATIVAGWYLSGHLGFLPEDPETLEPAFLATNSGRMESLSFVAPLAYTLDLLMLWTDKSRSVSLGIALSLGVVAGSLLAALLTRSFRIEGFRDAPDLARHLIGATLMGFGGVTALGCTIGQGLSGLSTLALGAVLTVLAIAAGASLSIRVQLQNA
ncbi:YeeE/YedE family protein [Zoogloea sp.]|uniref:YeeE/YedE family protein n=1 Tax=Zoogloea sp. TaxID=49181 RepID=UPI001AC51B89|nr:YeeE/YedE family protein [Zoogloea sp.]MBN8283197.1 YeeE/YedE family protein [Zoogloea sp.]